MKKKAEQRKLEGEQEVTTSKVVDLELKHNKVKPVDVIIQSVDYTGTKPQSALDDDMETGRQEVSGEPE